MAAWLNWETQLLKAIGAPATQENITFLDKWQQSEGGTAMYNPMNTTQTEPGSWGYNYNNGYPVQEYPNAATGLSATVKTLSGYPTLLEALKNGNPLSGNYNFSSDLNTWGSKGFLSWLIGRGSSTVQGSTGSPSSSGSSSANSGGSSDSISSPKYSLGVLGDITPEVNLFQGWILAATGIAIGLALVAGGFAWLAASEAQEHPEIVKAGITAAAA